jgi:ATP-dependent 26S proteasome regulatory subunit
MSDTDNRGQVLFILMTNRPDKLDIDIKRAGRLDRKIPFFYPEDVEAVKASVNALCKRYGFSLEESTEESCPPQLEHMLGYSYADIEAVTLLANNLAQSAGEAKISSSTLALAITDYLPNRDRRMIEFMELQAVLESSRRSMLPRKYRDLDEETLQLQIKQLRLELRL